MKRYKRILIFTTSFLALYLFGFTGGYFYIKNTQKAESKESYSYEIKNVADVNKDISEVKEIQYSTVQEQQMLSKERKINKKTNSNNTRIAYLTFDDGPSTDITPKILNILEEYDIKGTFFIIGKNAEENRELIKKEYKQGHVIGSHSYSHNLNLMYKDMDFFKDDIDKGFKVIQSILGEDYECNLFRFPGGVFEEKAKEPYKKYIKEMGKKFYDWNCLNGDAEGNGFTKERLFNRFKETLGDEKKVIILMHDTQGKKSTPEALPMIIDYLKEKGYNFETLKDY